MVAEPGGASGGPSRFAAGNGAGFAGTPPSKAPSPRPNAGFAIGEWCRRPQLLSKFIYSSHENWCAFLEKLTRWTNWTNMIEVKTVNVHQAKTNFSKLLAQLEKTSEAIVICRNGQP